MSFSETISPFFGRCAFVWFYLTSAMDILGNWHSIATDMTNKHIPIPPLVLLFGMTIVAAVTMHDFWHYGDASARAYQFGIFARDFAICGGLLMMVGMGPGPFAVDNAGKGGGKKR